MKRNHLEIYTRRDGKEQIFCMDQKGTVSFQDGEQKIVKEAGQVTAAQIFFLIDAYRKEHSLRMGEEANEMPSPRTGEEANEMSSLRAGAEAEANITSPSDFGRDGWRMILAAENSQELFSGELGEITVGSTYLSAFIRQRIMIRNMMLFDGKETGLSFR